MNHSQTVTKQGTMKIENSGKSIVTDRLALFLLIMAGYSLASFWGQRLVNAVTYQRLSDFFMNWGKIAHSYFSSVYDAISILIWQIPIVLFLFSEKNKIKNNANNNTKENIWIFDAIIMVLICMNALIPLASALTYGTEYGSLLGIASAAILIFLCGCYSNNSALKTTAGIYFVLAFLGIIVVSRIMFSVYLSSSAESYNLSVIYNTIAPYASVIYVAAGYGIAGIYAMHSNKKTEQK